MLREMAVKIAPGLLQKVHLRLVMPLRWQVEHLPMLVCVVDVAVTVSGIGDNFCGEV